MDKINLAANIKKYRKSKGITQERLAEVLGVTTGAVYKWESGKAVPELALIISIAAFFEISVEALLGYRWQTGAMGDALKQIKNYTQSKDYKRGVPFVEKSLLKFPNSFAMVYESAMFYLVSFEEEKVRHSIELFRKAEGLIDQNTDERICIHSIENDVARAYLILGDIEKAADIMKKNNVNGINSCELGLLYAKEFHEPEEAMNYLSEAIADTIARIHKLCSGLAHVYLMNKEYEKAADAIGICISVMEMFKKPGKISFLDRQQSFLYVAGAIIEEQRDEVEKAREYLKKARNLAIECDKNPDNRLTSIKFYCGKDTSAAYDDCGGSAEEGIVKILDFQKEEGKHQTTEGIKSIWESVKEEQGDGK